MRISLRFLLLYTAAFAVALALCYLPSTAASGFVLLSVIFVLHQYTPKSLWRHLTYGALLGIAGVLLLIFAYTKVKMGIASSNYEMGRVLDGFIWGWNYILPLGSFFGGSVGLLLYYASQEPIDPYRKYGLVRHEHAIMDRYTDASVTDCDS